jgi:hypothetical protein
MKTKIIALAGIIILATAVTVYAEIIRNLTALTGANTDATNDRLIINDDSANTDKSITIAEFHAITGTLTNKTLTDPIIGAAGVQLLGDGDGALRFLGLGNGSDEDLTLNFDDTANSIVASSSTGAGLDFSGMATSVGPLADANGVALHVIYKTVGTGTAYTMTNAYATVDMGTTDPAITIAAAGTYRVWANVQLNFAGASYAAFDSATFRIYRTNNTAAIIDADAERGCTLPIMTTATALGPSVVVGPIEYVTAATDDAVTIQGDLASAPSAGSVTVTKATIYAERVK